MMHFVIEGNTLKTKRKEKVKQMFVLKNHVDKLQIKKKKFNKRYTNLCYIFVSKHLKVF